MRSWKFNVNLIWNFDFTVSLGDPDILRRVGILTKWKSEWIYYILMIVALTELRGIILGTGGFTWQHGCLVGASFPTLCGDIFLCILGSFYSRGFHIVLQNASSVACLPHIASFILLSSSSPFNPPILLPPLCLHNTIFYSPFVRRSHLLPWSLARYLHL